MHWKTRLLRFSDGNTCNNLIQTETTPERNRDTGNHNPQSAIELLQQAHSRLDLAFKGRSDHSQPTGAACLAHELLLSLSAVDPGRGLHAKVQKLF